MTDDTQILADPAVEAFVDQVRAGLDDLAAEQREELLDGLAADLTEQLADGAEGLLDDPAAYAAELRAAAGLPERRRVLPRPHLPTPRRIEYGIDRARSGWLRRVGHTQTWEVLEALRPTWWVARAWVAVTLADQATGWWEPVSVVPSFDVPGLGPLVLAVAVVVSVLIGLARAWPGSGPDRPVASRVVLIVLNVVAVVAPLSFQVSLPGYLYGTPSNASDAYYQAYQDARSNLGGQGLSLEGRPVHNVFAYDATGRPLEGVQLFDQDGRPLAVRKDQAHQGRGADRTVGCPWLNGASPLYNVFPLAQRHQQRGTCTPSDGEAAMPEPPLATVPRVEPPQGVPEPAASEAGPRRKHGQRS